MAEHRGEPRLPVLTGRAWTFADDLAAADILPLRFSALAPAEAARHLFEALDPTLAAALEPGDVLVAGQNLGHGPGGVAAARTLAAAGMIAVVAGGFGAGFVEALLEAGLPPLEVDAPASFHTGQRMRLNLEGGTIANLSSGDRQPVRNLDTLHESSSLRLKLSCSGEPDEA
jgi:3-isopropylmalate/(R)-2-methylmalate dehydratase small subunit